MGSGLNFVVSIYKVKRERPQEQGMQPQSQRLYAGAFGPNGEISRRVRRGKRGHMAENWETNGG